MSTARPSGIRLTTVLLLAAIALAHIIHMFHTSARGRTWHAGHVVMALGMIAMAWRSGAMPVTGRGALERLLIIWFIVEAMGWATGRIPVLGHNHDTHAARASTVTIRASLAAMSIIMAIMFLSMLPPAATHPMPGM